MSKSKVIFARGLRFSTVAAMGTSGILATKTFTGACDSQTFIDFIVEEVVRQFHSAYLFHSDKKPFHYADPENGDIWSTSVCAGP